jgi:hypothetical protein
MRSLSPQQVLEAQAEAQRLNRNTVEHASKSGVEIKGHAQ